MKYKRHRNIYAKILLLSAAAGIFALSYFRVLDNYELETLDLRFKIRPAIRTTDKVVIIEISDDAIATLGRWPFDRKNHALMIQALSSFGARAVLFDIFFSEPSEHDEDVRKAIKDAGNVYMPVVFDMDLSGERDILSADKYQAVTIDAYRTAVKGEGQINIIPDNDGKFRRVPLYVRYKDTKVPYISFFVGCEYLGIAPKDISLVPGKYIQAGPDIKVPLDEHSEMIINYSGTWGRGYKHYSYVDVIQSYLAPMLGQKPIIDPEKLRGKICLVGLTAPGTVDLHPNPFDALCPGMGIHAEVINSLINRRFITRASREANIGILALLLAALSIVSLRVRPGRALKILCCILAAFIIASILAFSIYGCWIDVFYPSAAILTVFLGLMLYRFAIEWKKRLMIESELSIAKKIQCSFLPAALPRMDGVDMAAEMLTAQQVGGDMYNFLEFNKDRLGIMVGDVSGKGIPASLFMALVTGEFKFFSGDNISPETTLANLNERLVRDSASNLFVTMYYLILDMKSHTLSCGNAGHLPVLHVSKDRVDFLDVSEGMPLGLVEGKYSGRVASFDKGDIFILYTDGITEAMNRNSELYGKDRLAMLVSRSRHLTAKDIVKVIMRDIRQFESGSEQHDDITVIAVKVKS